MSNDESVIGRVLKERTTNAALDAIEQLTVVPDLMGAFTRKIELAQRWDNVIHAYLADDECPHGHLRTDDVITCECFGQLAPRASAPARVEGGLQVLTCRACGQEWTRKRQPGRPPHYCEPCRGASA